MSKMPSDLRVKFLCDPNLGRLAKWLRIMGFDTEYIHHWDNDTIRNALSSQRIFLTRKRKLAARKNHLVIISDHVEEQLIEVDRALSIKSQAKPFTRCNVCNERLIYVKPDRVKGLVPEYVHTTQEEFAMCSKCSRIFWKGTHLDKSMNTLNTIFPTSEEQ